MIQIKKLASLTLFGLAVAFGFAAPKAQAQGKMAVLSGQDVLASLPEAQAANQRLTDIQKLWADTLQMMQTKAQTTLESYQKVFSDMNEEAKKKAQAELTTMQDQIKRYQDAKVGPQGELSQMQATILQPIFDKVKKAIEAYAKKEKFSIILEKGNALYVDNAIDITEKFKEYMKTVK
jgi:outer membrane protein